MATYFKGKKDYVGQNLNEKWTDLTKNENFVEAVSSIGGTPVVDEDINISLFPTTIPAITVGSTITHQVNLGVLQNKTAVLIGVNVDNDIDQTILDGFGTSYFTNVIGGSTNWDPKTATNKILRSFYRGGIINWQTMVVYEDYLQSKRNFTPYALIDPITRAEAYGPSQTILPYGLTYGDIGVGVFVGYYADSFPPSGVFQIDKKVELQAAYLTQSGNNTILNLVLTNQDSVNSTAKDCRVIVYE